MGDPFRKILGVRFYVSDLEGLLQRLPGSGLVVAPSAPVLVRMAEDPAHRDAMEGADLAITDSAFMVGLWLVRTGERVRRISGLRLLRGILARRLFDGPGETFWIMPSREDWRATLPWLRAQGYAVGPDDAYVAPLYARQGPLDDPELVRRVVARRPKLVVVALAGGVQERLGWFLSRSLSERPTVLCIGGAIAFLTGRQNAIPVWADRLALGWLLRFLAAPRSFAAKLRGVQRLPGLVWKWGPGGLPPA